MISPLVLLALVAATAVSGVPLNINLGAYSPALVVGDGEISFGNNPGGASEVLQTLASGAANGAVGAGTAPPLPAAAMNPTPEVLQPAAAASVPAGQLPPPQGISSPIVATTVTPETNGQEVKTSPTLTTAGFISHAVNPGYIPGVSRFPNVVKREYNSDVSKLRIKRDIDGFREALNFARDALRNSPKVEVGSENAGIGIIVNPGLNVPANSAANGARPAGVVKRSLSDEKLGMTLIAISEI